MRNMRHPFGSTLFGGLFIAVAGGLLVVVATPYLTKFQADQFEDEVNNDAIRTEHQRPIPGAPAPVVQAPPATIAPAVVPAPSTKSPASGTDFFEALGKIFSGASQLRPEDVPRGRVVPSQFLRQTVRYNTLEGPGTIIIDARSHYLYYALGGGQAIRYGVAVGRSGYSWKGSVRIGDKAEWPVWYPNQWEIESAAKSGRTLPTVMAGGKGNPLGARALYLHGANGDTGFRIHGTFEPWTIGLNCTSGDIQLVNDDVIDLYSRARIGAKVIVM